MQSDFARRAAAVSLFVILSMAGAASQSKSMRIDRQQTRGFPQLQLFQRLPPFSSQATATAVNKPIRDRRAGPK